MKLVQVVRGAVFACVVLFCVPDVRAVESNKPVSAKIYCMSWNIVARSGMDAKTVREVSSVVIEIREPIRAEQFLRWLRLDQLQPVAGDPKPGDARWVVDFKLREGQTLSYYASHHALFSANSKRSKPINDAFRARFEFGEDAAKASDVAAIQQ